MNGNHKKIMMLMMRQVPKATQQAMQGKRARVAKKTISTPNDNPDQKEKETSSTETSGKNNAQESAVTTNTFYEPTILPDYGGDVFQHVNAKLPQLHIRDVDNKLIAPQNWYSALRLGTLVMVRVTLHAFNWKERRVREFS
jgi:hypothetical protein